MLLVESRKNNIWNITHIILCISHVYNSYIIAVIVFIFVMRMIIFNKRRYVHHSRHFFPRFGVFTPSHRTDGWIFDFSPQPPTQNILQIFYLYEGVGVPSLAAVHFFMFAYTIIEVPHSHQWQFTSHGLMQLWKIQEKITVRPLSFSSIEKRKFHGKNTVRFRVIGKVRRISGKGNLIFITSTSFIRTF